MLDSGCTQHMTSDMRMVTEMSKVAQPMIASLLETITKERLKV